MLVNQGELLQQAHIMLDESGYQYKKGKSRSKNFGSVSGADEPKLKCPRTDHEVRTKRKQEIEEEILTINKQLTFKGKRMEAGAQDKDFKLCDQLTEEIANLQRNRRALELERRGLEKKEKKSTAVY